MPKFYNYSPIISLISSPRINSYRVTFKPNDDVELYGVYIWSQHASSSLYPLTQNLEITLRNAIDMEARSRFGDFWWNSIAYESNKQSGNFIRNITAAQAKLQSDWEKKERKRLGIHYSVSISTTPPVWTHDQIVGATDFSTWQFILGNAFNAKNPRDNHKFLWPKSLGKVFRQFSIINGNQNKVRHAIIDIVNELREYRNRLFHHETVWIKDTGVIDARTAINTIREKINKIELLISAIDHRKISILKKVGLLGYARRVCSYAELDIYRYFQNERTMTRRKKRVLRSIVCEVNHDNTTATWSYGDSLYGIYKIR